MSQENLSQEELSAQNQEVVSEGNDQEQVDNTFNPELFISGSSDEVSNDTVNNESDNQSDSNVNEDDQGNADDTVTWNDFSAADEPEDTNEEQSKTNTEDSDDKGEQESIQESFYKNEDLEVDLKSRDDLDAYIKKQNARIKELEQSNPSTLSEKSVRLMKLKELNDRELFKKSLIAQNLNEEDAEFHANAAEKEGRLKLEADKVRAGIDKAVSADRNQRQKDVIEKQQEDDRQAKENAKAIREYMSDQTEMFGLKIGKTDEEISEVRKNHSKYINDGKFFNDIMKSPQAVAEAAWLIKNKEVIMNAFKNKGAQSSRKEFMENKLGVPSSLPNNSVANTVRDVSDPGGFDPSKFING